MNKNNQTVSDESQNNKHITDPYEVADGTLRADGQFKGQLSIDDI